jgi:hypothetical protein
MTQNVPDYSAKAAEALENAEQNFKTTMPQTGIYYAVLALGYAVMSVSQEISRLPKP